MSFKPIKDKHGNDDIFSIGNLDFSKFSHEEFEKEKQKFQEKSDGGHFRLKTTIKDGLVVVQRESGSEEVYQQDAFEGLRAVPKTGSPSFKEKKSIPLNASQQPNELGFQTTATKVVIQIGKVNNAPPELQKMAREHEEKIQQSIAQGKIAVINSFPRQQIDNPALITNAESLIQKMRGSIHFSDRDVKELEKELQKLLESFKGCELHEERDSLLKEIDEKIKEILFFFNEIFKVSL